MLQKNYFQNQINKVTFKWRLSNIIIFNIMWIYLNKIKKSVFG